MKIQKTIILAISVFFAGHSQSIEKFSIDSGGSSTTAGGIELIHTIGEVAIAERSNANLILSEGFINATLKIRIDPVVFLQGPFTNPVLGEENLMRDDLRVNGLIPTTSPYEDAISCNATVFDVTGSNAIVDWIWIELRDSNDNTMVVLSQSALLQRDGDIVDIDGISLLDINLPTGNYFVVISHRNHLGIMTANPINLSGGTTFLNFTTDSNDVFGGTNAINDLGNGLYALYSGDFNGDGQVQNTDRLEVEILRGINGYDNADIDG
ncbi:hemagglutinin protein, partial [Winogradskyella aquimaris]